MAVALEQRAQIIRAPSNERHNFTKSVFLAGTTARTDQVSWRERLLEHLSDLPLTICDPYRPDWGADWNDLSCPPYREQIEWELRKQENVDIVVFYFHSATPAPISMLELGLRAKHGIAIVCVPEGFGSRANVLCVCEQQGIEVVKDVEDFKPVIRRLLGLL